ncbi:MAG: hypothetical protein NTW26_11975, partial [bacterium]|nr:hypothetical protein [bacterium]
MTLREQSIQKVSVDLEMRRSYLSYAMSVIVGRALPDVRDGLKPVHRRLIYAMQGLGLASNKPHRKAARIVGEAMGKFHPHGDANGSTGIAVGMASHMPPHNLGEVCRALVRYIDDPDVSLGELMKIIPGPDFPTGGVILGRADIIDAYSKGRGKLTVRGRTTVEEPKGRGPQGKARIIITEIPYQVNKSRLVEQIADLVRSKTVDGVSDLRDESDRRGV